MKGDKSKTEQPMPVPQNERLAVRPKQPIAGQQTFMDLLDKV